MCADCYHDPKLWDEIRGTHREMEISGAEQALLEFQEMLAAWKIKYYVQKYRDGKAYETLDDEKKNVIRQCRALKKKVHHLQEQMSEYLGKGLEELSQQLGDEKSCLELELDKARGTSMQLSAHIEKLNATIDQMRADQEQLRQDHAAEVEQAAAVLRESRTETAVAREEVDVARRACQDYLRTVTALENKLQDAQTELAGHQSGDHKDSLRLQARIDSMERDMQGLVDRLDTTIEEKNSLQADLDQTRASLEATTTDLSTTASDKSALEKSHAELEEELEARQAQIGSLERLVTEISVQRDNMKDLLSDGTMATSVYKADMARLQAQLDAKSDEANELQRAHTMKCQELAAALRSDEATSQLLERTAMNVEDLEMRVLVLDESNTENFNYARVLEAQVLQARRQETRGGVRTADAVLGSPTHHSLHPPGSAPTSTYDIKRLLSPGNVASMMTSHSVGHNTGHGGAGTPSPYFEDYNVMDDSMLSGSVVSSAMNPLENRLVSLLALLEDKLGQLDGVVRQGQGGSSADDVDPGLGSVDGPIMEEDSQVTQDEDSDSRVMTEGSRVSAEPSWESREDWEEQLQQLEENIRQLEEQLLEERNNLENVKIDLSDARDEIQVMQKEKDELKEAIKNYQRKYQRKYGRAPPAEGGDAESMALIEHFQQVQTDMQARLTEAQSIATEALNLKMECDRLQEELSQANDELEVAKMEYEDRQNQHLSNMKTRNLQRPSRPRGSLIRKPKDMKVVKEEEDDDESYVTANGGSRSTVEGSGSVKLTPVPPSRPKSTKLFSELDSGKDSRDAPRSTRKFTDGKKPKEDENGSQIMSFDTGSSASSAQSSVALHERSGSGESSTVHKRGTRSSVEEESVDSREEGRNSSGEHIGPTDSLQEFGSVEEPPNDDASAAPLDAASLDDNVSAYSSLHGASVTAGEEEEEGTDEEREQQQEHGSIEDSDVVVRNEELVSLDDAESMDHLLQIVRTRLRYHKQVLNELADEKENCRDAIERWTVYFLKEQGRVPGLADSKYGTNCQVFENFNGAQHDVYAHHMEVQQLFDHLNSKREEIEESGLGEELERLEEEFQDPVLSLPEGEEYEDAYKLHFESVETLLANGPPDSDDMSITSTNTALTGFFPNGVLDFANLTDVAKLDVLENIENDIRQFNQDIMELHTSLHDTRSHAQELNTKLNGLKAELKAWHRDYVQRHGHEPSDKVKENEVADLYLECHELHSELEEEMEKMRTIALISTAKATEVDRLKVLKRRFVRRAPAAYAGSVNESGSQASLSSSLSNLQSRSRDLSERSSSYISATKEESMASMSLKSDASSRSLKFAKESLQKDIAKMSDDLDMLNQYISTADEDMKELRARKEECKQAAKQWEEDFIRDHKRKPTVAERKTQVEDLYDEYANLQEEIAEVLEQREKAMKMITKIEQSMEHKVNKLGIISEHEGN